MPEPSPQSPSTNGCKPAAETALRLSGLRVIRPAFRPFSSPRLRAFPSVAAVPVASSIARLLADLIALPSVNPAFLQDEALAGEQRVAEHLAHLAGRAGLAAEFQPVLPGRHNLILRLTPPGRVRRRVLLAPHLDTVGEPNYAALHKPVIRRGRVIGRGACDTKGSVAVYFSALMALARSGVRPAQTEIVFIGLVDEEDLQSGSRLWARSNPPADLALIGEPTGLQVVTAHKGCVWLQLRSRGRAAHGAMPHLGRNALEPMARAVLALLDGYSGELAARPPHPLLGRPTINLGSLHGGRQPNIVPADCTLAIDRRTVPGETEASVRRELAAFLKARGLRIGFDNLRTVACPPLETDPSIPLVQQLLRAARRSRPVGVHYFTDAAPLAEGGTPSVVFGPGYIAQAHTADEWIAIDQLERAQAVVERFLRSLP
jgi:acetylornithine deacetylase/succinyl-diaminopimelate desuccinylase-like protein